MNIFYLNECPVKCAEAQPDKMLVKMILETAQMLSTAHRELDGAEYADARRLYKTAYKNHPCTIWARESSGNYEWLFTHFLALGNEYTFRYAKYHASLGKLAKHLLSAPKNIEQGSMTPLAQCMPDKYKNDDPVKAYRDYCIHEKHYAKWDNGRDKPTWWKAETDDETKD